MDKCVSNVTIVSALVYIGRDKWKHSGFGIGNDAYKNWVKNLLSLDTCLYFYVDDYYYDYIIENRRKYDPEFKKTIIKKVRLDELIFFRDYYKDLSTLMSSHTFKSRIIYKSAAEMNYSLYNIINFNKIEFIKKTYEENYFESDYFYWADAGGMRESIDKYENQKWPTLSKEYFNDKIIHFSHTDNLTINESKFDYFISQNRRIQGTAWIVPKDKVNVYYDLIYNEISSMIKEGIVGSDEKVYDFLYVNNKDLFKLKQCGWFEYYNLCKNGTNDLVEIKKKSNQKSIVKIYTVVFSKYEFIKLQYDQLVKFCKDDFELIVVNNAKNEEIDNKIKTICNEIGIRCIDSPRDHNIANISHFNAINFALDNYAKKDSTSDILVIMDGDIFAYRDFSFQEILGNHKVAAVYQQRQDETIEYLHPIFSILSYDLDLTELDYSWKAYTDCGGRTDDFIRKYNLNVKWVDHTAALDIETDYIFRNNNNVPYPYKSEYRSQFINNCLFHYYRGDNWDEKSEEYHKQKFEFTKYFLENYLSYDLNLDEYVHYDKAHAEKGWEGKDYHYHGYKYAILKGLTKPISKIKSNNVFIDLGTHSCQGLEKFINNILPIDQTWEIHTFEPNPILDPERCVKNIFNDKYNITAHKKAVWIYNGKVNFGLYGPDGKSGGCLVEETNGGINYQDKIGQIEVECIDFVEFVNKFNNRDNIFIKMDIEWSEYFILDKMLNSGWSKNIKTIWVQFHGINDDIKTKERMDLLIEKIKSTGTNLEIYY